LEDEATITPETPLASRQMLAVVCEEVCAEAQNVPRASRHEYVTSVLDMIQEALREIHDVKRNAAEKSQQDANAIAADSCRFNRLEDACVGKRAGCEASKADTAEKSNILITLKNALAKATELERAASSSIIAAEKAEKACMSQKLAADAALKAFETLESSGTPSQAGDAKKLFKQIEAQMNVMNMKATLFPRVVNAVIPALQLKPDSRSGFEDGALAAAEGCFTNYIREKQEMLSTLSRGTAAAQDRQRRANGEVAQVRQEIDAGGEALLDARDNQRECDNALRDAERSRKEHREEAVLLRKTAKAHAVMLANFDKLLKVFASLVCGT